MMYEEACLREIEVEDFRTLREHVSELEAQRTLLSRRLGLALEALASRGEDGGFIKMVYRIEELEKNVAELVARVEALEKDVRELSYPDEPIYCLGPLHGGNE